MIKNILIDRTKRSRMKKKFEIPELGNKVPRSGSRLTYWFGVQFLKLKGWRFNGAFPNRAKMIVAVAPHTSNWDFFIGISIKFCFRLKIQFLGKHSIFVPVVGSVLRAWGGIPVERTKKHGVVEQMTDIFEQQDELILCLSPEGTRKRIEKWKTGFIQIARKAEVPILLIGLDYQKKTIEIGPVVSVGEDVEAAMQQIFNFFSGINAKYPESFHIPEIDLTVNKSEK